MSRNSNEVRLMRAIPSVDEILRTHGGRLVNRELGRDASLRMARAVADEIRRSVDSKANRARILDLIENKLLSKLATVKAGRLQKVINAAGVIIHTNLGRSPLSEDAVDAITRNASGYCNVELDLGTGERGRRGGSAEILLAEIAGAEDAVIVNNCAAAALLVLAALASSGEVIVSRGELVEIGGDFRIPDVLEQSGCRLREVGTTNRTKLADYERAICSETKAILRVHPSNYRITGFTETPDLESLAGLSRRNSLILFEDAGSGALVDLSEFGLGDEPVIHQSISAGVDIVAFSGDKLVGGVQAGLIAGKKELVEKVRRHPLYRAVRADKMVYAAVEATLGSFAREQAFEEIPTLRMLSLTFEEIDSRARKLVDRINKLSFSEISCEIILGESAIGGGAGTGVTLATSLVAVSHSTLTADELAAAFRRVETPVVARISDGRLLLDLRTVPEKDEQFILEAMERIATS
jgi:L-seryl-tRNA(Ser) seleniumtransferase